MSRSRSPGATDVTALLPSDPSPGVGLAFQLPAAVTGHDGTVLAAVSGHVEHPHGRSADAELVVVVAGDVDQDTAPLVQLVLTAALDEHLSVCLDLAEVTFFGAAGANMIVAADTYATRMGSRFSVRGARALVRRVLRITGVDRSVTVAG